jgi:hypothetical protein
MASGLEDVVGDAWIPSFPGGSTMAEFWKLTWLEARESLPRHEMTDECLEPALAALDDDSRWFPGWAIVAGWGRTQGSKGSPADV